MNNIILIIISMVFSLIVIIFSIYNIINVFLKLKFKKQKNRFKKILVEALKGHKKVILMEKIPEFVKVDEKVLRN